MGPPRQLHIVTAIRATRIDLALEHTARVKLHTARVPKASSARFIYKLDQLTHLTCKSKHKNIVYRDYNHNNKHIM